MNVIEIIRASVRPFIAVSITGTIIFIGISLIAKFADADMAMLVVTFILATGGTVTGFYFGERAVKKEKEPKP